MWQTDQVHEYQATLVRVIDGDTVELDIDLGFHVHVREKIRLADIDAPEVRTRDPEEKQRGIEARDALEKMLRDKALIVLTAKDRRSFSRWVATIYLDHGEEQISVQEEMVSRGFAVRA